MHDHQLWYETTLSPDNWMWANAAMLGFPALILLVTDGKWLPANSHWNYGVFTKPIYVISVGYSILVVIVSAVSGFLKSDAANSQDI